MANKRKFELTALTDAKKRTPSYKRHKLGLFSEYAFFDEVKRLLINYDVYKNFLYGFKLYNDDFITERELLWLAVRFIGKFPAQFSWLKRRLYRHSEKSQENDQNEIDLFLDYDKNYRSITGNELDIDYVACKRYSSSYRPLPLSVVRPKCSGSNNPLCGEVLNNFCVSFPSWQSEDSTLVSSKKTLHEECIYRIEDERFELDIVIEVNKRAIHALENAKKRMAKMSETGARIFKLGENFGSEKSKILHACAIKRVYGEKSQEIIDGLMGNPYIAVPLVLNRLKAKEIEWKEAQKAFNRVWTEQSNKSYAKSLEIQWSKFKQNDLKMMRSKILLNQIETLHEERLQKICINGAKKSTPFGTLLQLEYPARPSILADVNSILLCYAEKNFSGPEIVKIKHVLQTVMILLDVFSFDTFGLNNTCKFSTDVERSNINKFIRIVHANKCTSIYLPESFYVFLRLHNLLTERLDKFYLDCMADNSKLDRYFSLLANVKKLLKNEIDNASFETSLVHTRLQNGCIFLTICKIVANCLKQVGSILNDEKWAKTRQIYLDFYCDHILPQISPKYEFLSDEDEIWEKSDELQYETAAEKIFGTQAFFKTTFVHNERKVNFDTIVRQKFASSECDDNEQFEISEKFAAYLQNYANFPGSDSKLYAAPMEVRGNGIFLRRNLAKYAISRNHADQLKIVNNDASAIFKDFVFSENLLARVSLENQKLHYVADTWDSAFRLKPYADKLARKCKRNATSRYRMFNFLKWYKNWLTTNVNQATLHQVESWFLYGVQSPKKSTESPTVEQSLNFAQNIEKTTVNCDLRPFSYKRNFYLIDAPVVSQKLKIYRLDID